MILRDILSSWGIAFMCLVVFIFTISVSSSAIKTSCPVYQPKMSDTGIIAIGSSLTLYAFATDPVETGPLDDVTTWWIPNLGPNDGLHLLRCAVETDARQILIEANTFAFGRVNAPLKPNSLQFDDVLTSFTEDVRLIIGRTLFGEEDRRIGGTASILSKEGWDGMRPERRHEPRYPLQSAWVETLRDINMSYPGRIVLFEPPRTAMQLEDISSSFDPQETLSALADGAALPLITIGLEWEPSNFVDYYSHLHPRGRERFQQAFAASLLTVSDAY
jgi:hypothetical protein